MEEGAADGHPIHAGGGTQRSREARKDDPIALRQVRKEPVGEEVEKTDAHTVRRGQHDRYHNTVPAILDHQVKRQLTDTVQGALSAPRKETPPNPPPPPFQRTPAVVI